MAFYSLRDRINDALKAAGEKRFLECSLELLQKVEGSRITEKYISYMEDRSEAKNLRLRFEKAGIPATAYWRAGGFELVVDLLGLPGSPISSTLRGQIAKAFQIADQNRFLHYSQIVIDGIRAGIFRQGCAISVEEFRIAEDLASRFRKDGFRAMTTETEIGYKVKIFFLDSHLVLPQEQVWMNSDGLDSTPTTELAGGSCPQIARALPLPRSLFLEMDVPFSTHNIDREVPELVLV